MELEKVREAISSRGWKPLDTFEKPVARAFWSTERLLFSEDQLVGTEFILVPTSLSEGHEFMCDILSFGWEVHPEPPAGEGSELFSYVVSA